MSKAVERFIESLKSLSQRDIKPYPFEEYDCELAFVQKCAFRGDFLNAQLVEMWKKIYSKPCFELHHPTKNHILTRAILSWRPNDKSLRNLVYFVDEANQHPWILVTTYESATSMITLDEFFINPLYMSNNEHDRWLRWVIPQDCIKMLDAQSTSIQKWLFKDSPYILSLQSERPHHYFTDSLFWYKYLGLTNSVEKQSLFFILDSMPLQCNNGGGGNLCATAFGIPHAALGLCMQRSNGGFYAVSR